MDRRSYLAAAGAVAAGLAGCVGGAGRAGPGGDGRDDDGDADDGLAVETVAGGFTRPWALQFLPNGRLLVTERPGRLRLVDPETGRVEDVGGVPDVFARGQGGLLDVALHPAFPDEPWVYLTYAVAGRGGTSSTRVGRGRLSIDGPRLVGVEPLYTAEPFVESSGHFGSRLAVRDGDLYVTVGDRQFKDFGPDHVAQDRSNDLGTTLRLRSDGAIPADNPFVDDPDARDAIYSYGHRNAQGMAVHPSGALWQSEFGERDGDEINRVERGANYGWPVADEGCAYGSDQPIGASHDDRADVVAPAHTWPCGSGGFPPSGMTVYEDRDGARPAWDGDLLVGGLASRSIAHVSLDGDRVAGVDRLLADRGWRVRDVEQAPDGRLYAAIDAGDAPVVRLVLDDEDDDGDDDGNGG